MNFFTGLLKQDLSNLLLPFIVLLLLIVVTIKRLPAFDYFTSGVKEAVNVSVGVFPYICTIMIAVALLRESGLAVLLSRAAAPAFNLIGIPTELAELILLRPFSGSGSIALFNELIGKYGADSYIVRAASVMMSSTETVFYVSTIYFASTKVRKLRYAIPVALFATFAGTIIACLICRVL